jgi:hypothetical protein
MTNLKALLDAASPLPWIIYDESPNAARTLAIEGETCDPIILEAAIFKQDAELATIAVNSLPAVLKYMEGGHHMGCTSNPNEHCECGYDALRDALGLQEASDES